jgi:hypothetical protein
LAAFPVFIGHIVSVFDSMQTDSINERRRRLDKLENAACFSDNDLAGCLEALKHRSSISLPVLSGPALAGLVEAAGSLPFRPARAEVGKPEKRVYQEFDYCGAVPRDHPVSSLGPWMEYRLRRALGSMPEPPVSAGFTINDVVCQAYRPGDLGITPHRDHISYTGLIILVILCGMGRYFVCADRAGSHKREIPAGPGWAILMPGPGYAGRSDRPFHMVGDISEFRYSVGLRHDARRSGAPAHPNRSET